MSVLYETFVDSLRRWQWGPLAIELSGLGEETPVGADELLERVELAAGTLQKAGVERGVPVALFLDNSVDVLVVLFALFRLEAVPVIGKVEYRALELSEVFNNARPPVVVAESHLLPNLAPFLDGRTVIGRDPGILRIVEAGSMPMLPVEAEGAVASINYTYRGLGYPLGALLSPEQYLHGARVLQDGLQGEAGERMLFALPMSHIFTLVGCILVPILYGMPMVIARTIHPRRVFDAIERLQVSHITAVPELYRLLLRTRDSERPLPSLKTFVSGGSYLAPREQEALCDAFDIEVLHGYGLTEFTPVSRNMRNRSRTGTVGPVCGGVACTIAEDGEILIRTDSMRMEYYRRPKESAAARYGHWFRTGDAGHLADGHLLFDHEIKATRKVNGLLVDLKEVTKALLLHPEVRRATVEQSDGALFARIETSSTLEEAVLARDLRNFLRERIATYKIPQGIGLQS